MLRRLLNLSPEILSSNYSTTLRMVISAGFPLSPELGNRTVRSLCSGLYNVYGSTEVAVATVATPEDWWAAPGTVGYPPRGCVVKLYDETGKPVSSVERRGRIFVTNDLRVDTHIDKDAKEVIAGLVDTGDVGHVDANGRLFVDGRQDDLIITGGENVYPGAVEDLLSARDDVDEAAVVGLPDDEFGQRLRAYIVPRRPGSRLDADELKAYVRESRPRYEVPRDIVFLDELPRNDVGKVVRRDLSRTP